MLRQEEGKSRPPRQEQSAALQRAIAGRPSFETVLRGQLSARTRRERDSQRLQAEEDERRVRTAEEQLAAAAKGHLQAAGRLRERQAQMKTVEAKLRQHRDSEAEKRGEAIAALKASTAAVHADMAQAAKNKARKRAEASAQREEEAARLAAAGYNPYLVLRQKEEAQRVMRERKRQDAELVARMTDHRARMATAVAREKGMRDQRKDEKPPPTPPHEWPYGGPRTLCDPSVVELG